MPRLIAPPQRNPHRLKHMRRCLVMLVLLSLLSLPTPNETSAYELDRRALLFTGPTPTVDPAFRITKAARPTASPRRSLCGLPGGASRRHQREERQRRPDRRAPRPRHRCVAMVWAGGTYSTPGSRRMARVAPGAHHARRSRRFHLPLALPSRLPCVEESRYRRAHPNVSFDGIELVEAFFPNWNGLQSGVRRHRPFARAAFRERYGEEPRTSSIARARYYTKVPDLYENGCSFGRYSYRMADELINGDGGIRDVRPGIPVATWTLATDWPN